jgi:hypothetical protein
MTKRLVRCFHAFNFQNSFLGAETMGRGTARRAPTLITREKAYMERASACPAALAEEAVLKIP